MSKQRSGPNVSTSPLVVPKIDDQVGNADAVDEDAVVALHFLRHRLADGAGVVKPSHGTHLRAAGRAVGIGACDARFTLAWMARSISSSIAAMALSPSRCSASRARCTFSASRAIQSRSTADWSR